MADTPEVNSGALDERKLAILKAVVEEYIDSFEPVGSRTISKKEGMSISPATIRNEMSDLEEMGYLQSPHTSAGRVPSTKGYRTYVDEILKPAGKNPEVALDLVGMLEDKVSEYGKLMKACTQLISEMTQYIAIGVSNGAKSFIIKALQIVPVDENNVLIVIVADNDIIKNRMITLPEPMQPGQVIELSTIINSMFAGRPAELITLVMINKIVESTGISRNIMLPIVDGIIDCVKQCKTSEIFTEGASKLLKCPEFDDIEKARNFIDMIQDKDMLEKLTEAQDNDDIHITIGTENPQDGLSDYSVISANLEVEGVCIGSLSVVGPTRMDYSKVINAIESMKLLISNKAKKNNNILPAPSADAKNEEN